MRGDVNDAVAVAGVQFLNVGLEIGEPNVVVDAKRGEDLPAAFRVEFASAVERSQLEGVGSGSGQRRRVDCSDAFTEVVRAERKAGGGAPSADAESGGSFGVASGAARRFP